MDPNQRRNLIAVARRAIAAELTGVRSDDLEPTTLHHECGGLFVTLRNEGILRGCMGTFNPAADLVQAVDRVARTASRDPRFTSDPIRPDEITRLEIEVSVLSTPEPLADPATLRVGRHGVIVRRGDAGGCFLPQVAVEHGWSAEQFIDRCCTLKAGLPAGAWRESTTTVHCFTTESFSD